MQSQHTGTVTSVDSSPNWRGRDSIEARWKDADTAMPDPEVLRAIVERIQRNDEKAKYQLYQMFNRGIRFQLVRQLGPVDVEDKVHDTFLIVLQAIMRNDLRNPERLLGYIRTVVRRQIAGYIERAVERRRECPEDYDTVVRAPEHTPEMNYIRREEKRLMRQTLSELNPKDREILIRFYLDEMSQELICEEMGLTSTQFRLLKSRAKARFSELGKRQLRPKLISRIRAVAV